MLNLTPSAVVKIKSLIERENAEKAMLRIMVVGGGCSGFSYDMDFEDSPGLMDKILEFEGLKVCVDPESMKFLADTVVDYSDSIQAAGFHFTNAQATATCGCGTSFAVAPVEVV